MSSVSYESFKKDTAQHVLTVLKDDGVYRHLRVENPSSIEQHYSITTWPGYLCYSGDMGCYVFQRVDDMFTFFRKEPGYINESYWHEKLEAVDRNGDVEEWNQAAFEADVTEVLNAWLADNEDQEPDFIEEQKTKIQWLLDESSEYNAEHYNALLIHKFEPDEGGVEFVDFWEGSGRFMKYTARFIWCCHAIVHAIHLYDQLEAKESSQ